MSSEVARLRAQIAAEYEAAERALYGLAEGTARHQIITARMERMGEAAGQLAALVGIEQAAVILVEAIEVRQHSDRQDKEKPQSGRLT